MKITKENFIKNYKTLNDMEMESKLSYKDSLTSLKVFLLNKFGETETKKIITEYETMYSKIFWMEIGLR